MRLSFAALFLMLSVAAGQVHLRPVAGGFIFTNEPADSLWYSDGWTTDLLVAARGCGRYVACSPDGEWIGFKLIDGNGLQAPAMISCRTREFKLLHDPVAQAGQVAFGPDGMLAYAIGSRIMIEQGGRVRAIEAGSYANLVSMSADGKHLAFNDAQDRIVVLDAGSRDRRIVSGEGYAFPLWSPSGSRLCFARLDRSLFVHDIETGTTVALGEGYDPVWSPDGSSLVAARYEQERYVLKQADLFELPIDGSPAVRLTEGNDRFECEPVFTGESTLLFRDMNRPGLLHADINGSVLHPTFVSIPLQAPSRSRSAAVVSGDQQIVQPPAAFSFSMPYTNQVYDTPDWYNGRAACGPTSSIMVIAYYGLLPSWKVWCSYPAPGHWSDHGNYVCDRYNFHEISYSFVAEDPNNNPSWGGYGYMWTGTNSPYSRMAAYYNAHGLTAVTADAPPLASVLAEVSAGFPYTLCNGLTTAGHIIVINGIGAEQHTLIANDPYGDKNSGTYPSVNGKGVRYDWPGYNNGYQNLNTVYWGVQVRPPVPATVDSVVDDLQFTKGFFLNGSAPASMGLWKDRNVGYGGHFWYTTTKKSDSCYATWTIAPSRDGRYELSAHIPFSKAKAARYRITHQSGESVVTVDQTPFSYSWASLGVFSFTKPGGGLVRLGDASDSVNQYIVFDAVRWSYQGPLTTVEEAGQLPVQMSLEQNFPNPFNPTTAISYELGAISSQLIARSSVRLSIIDLLGREVAVLVDQEMPAGVHTATWNASPYSSGIYFYRLQYNGIMLTKKMLLAR